MIAAPCPSCGALCRDWTPYNVSGRLSIAFRCACEARWQVNGCSVILPPALSEMTIKPAKE